MRKLIHWIREAKWRFYHRHLKEYSETRGFYMDHMESVNAPAFCEFDFRFGHNCNLYETRPKYVKAARFYNPLPDIIKSETRIVSHAGVQLIQNTNGDWIKFKYGDWIVLDSDGNLNAISESSFHETYQPVGYDYRHLMTT